MIALLVALAVATNTQPAAPTVAERIARGEAALEQLEYLEAADELTRAAGDPAASDAEKLRANLLAGIANRIAGRDVDARLCFRFVLLRAPETALPADASPRVSDFYELVRQEIAAERADVVPLGAGARPRDEAPPVARQDEAAPAAPALAPPPPTPTPVVPLVLAGAGGLVAAVGVGLAVAGESVLSDAAMDGPDKAPWQTLGRVGLVAAAGGAVLLGAGAFAFVLE